MILIRRIVEFPLSKRVRFWLYLLSCHKPPSQYSSIGSGINHSRMIAIKSMQLASWTLHRNTPINLSEETNESRTWRASSDLLSEQYVASMIRLTSAPGDCLKHFLSIDLTWLLWDWCLLSVVKWQSLPDLMLCYLTPLHSSLVWCVKYNYNPPPPLPQSYHIIIINLIIANLPTRLSTSPREEITR